MRKGLLLLLMTIISVNLYSQIVFEKGYYINSSNQKIECFIKNEDWKNNPISFEYKTTENSISEIANINLVKEFGIYEVSKYYRETVKIDRSGDYINNLSSRRTPIFKKEKLFLKILIEGKVNLYEYVDGNLKRYFYKKENSNVEQLIYKRYISKEGNVVKNNRFRQQLWSDLKCSSFKLNEIENINYKKNDLIKFFNQYALCHNNVIINYEKKEKRDLFNITLRPRLNSSSLKIRNGLINSMRADISNEIGFGFGLESELILAFNKNKWSILIEPTYQYFKTGTSIDASDISGGKFVVKVDYSSIEMPIGLRHYLFLNKHSKFFINASFVFDFKLKSLVEFTREDGSVLDSLKSRTRNNMAFGLGYKIDDKYSIEFRYQTDREILDNYIAWNSGYRTSSIILGYTLF